jgi:hypothetical protein
MVNEDFLDAPHLSDASPNFFVSMEMRSHRCDAV